MTTVLTGYEPSQQTIIPKVPSGVDAGTTHKVIISVVVLIVVGVLMTEGAGISKNVAELVFILLFGVFLIEGMTHSQSFGAFSQTYPWQPPA